MKKYIAIFAVLSLLTVLISACGSSADTEPVIVEPDYLIAEGSLLPASALDMSFSIEGQVEKVLVEDGEQVILDQVLVKLEDVPEAQAALERARQEELDAQLALEEYKASAALNLAQAEIEVILTRSKYKNASDNYLNGRSSERKARMDEAEANFILAEDAYNALADNDGLDPEQYELFETALEAARAAVESAEASVDALQLRASLAGRVVDVNVIPGQKVSSGEVLMAVADFSQWIIKTDSLTETEVVEVELGQPVEVVLDALPDITLKGHVANINERFEEKRGDITYTVTVELEETDPLMRWGMTAAVYFLPVEETGRGEE